VVIEVHPDGNPKKATDFWHVLSLSVETHLARTFLARRTPFTGPRRTTLISANRATRGSGCNGLFVGALEAVPTTQPTTQFRGGKHTERNEGKIPNNEFRH
jgi:hypothetical protein